MTFTVIIRVYNTYLPESHNYEEYERTYTVEAQTRRAAARLAEQMAKEEFTGPLYNEPLRFDVVGVNEA